MSCCYSSKLVVFLLGYDGEKCSVLFFYFFFLSQNLLVHIVCQAIYILPFLFSHSTKDSAKTKSKHFFSSPTIVVFYFDIPVYGNLPCHSSNQIILISTQYLVNKTDFFSFSFISSLHTCGNSFQRP